MFWLVLALLSPAANTAPDVGYWLAGPKGNFYLIGKGQENWINAREFCMHRNADLMSVDNEDSLILLGLPKEPSGTMRVFYPIKSAQLLLIVVCLALMLNSKLLCVYKDPFADCQTEVFSPTRNGTEMLEETSLNGTEETSELEEKTIPNGTELVKEKTNTTGMMVKTIHRVETLLHKSVVMTNRTAVKENKKTVDLGSGRSLNETTEETSGETLTNGTSLNGTEETIQNGKDTKFHLRACLLIDSRDVYDPKSQLTPLFPLRVFCLLILELFLLALQIARVAMNYETPDQLTIMLNNLMHGFCWLITAVCLLMQKCAWQTEWSILSPDFVPIYPTEYDWAQLIAWANLVFLLVEALLFHDFIYYGLTMEKMEEQLVQPTVIVPAYKDSHKPLLYYSHY